MFSRKPKNRKRRVRRKPSQTKSWETESPAPARKRKPATEKEQMHMLHAQIGVLESFLEKKHASELRQMQMKAENILPPPDRSTLRRQRDAMSMAERRRYHAERSRNGIHFFFLFCLACAIGWWILFCTV
ncbi:MAG: hypothetical protein CMO55_05105 [Verrucomicrobiales bacterium]|nr:hypothetical protein [Verrucomicrobiales bacterium]